MSQPTSKSVRKCRRRQPTSLIDLCMKSVRDTYQYDWNQVSTILPPLLNDVLLKSWFYTESKPWTRDALQFPEDNIDWKNISSQLFIYMITNTEHIPFFITDNDCCIENYFIHKENKTKFCKGCWSKIENLVENDFSNYYIHHFVIDFYDIISDSNYWCRCLQPLFEIHPRENCDYCLFKKN